MGAAGSTPVAERGNIVVASLGDEATVKRLWISDERIELRADSPRYRPIVSGPADDSRIQCNVIAVSRGPANAS